MPKLVQLPRVTEEERRDIVVVLRDEAMRCGRLGLHLSQAYFNDLADKLARRRGATTPS